MERSMKWRFEKFKGDMAIYAICPQCGFYHNPSTLNRDMTTTIVNQYKFCPMCGEYLYVDGDNVDVIWNQRYISELYIETDGQR